METVLRGTAQRIDVARRQCSHEQRGATDVENRVAECHFTPELGSRFVGRGRRPRDPHHDRRVKCQRDLYGPPIGCGDDATEQRCGDVVCVSLQLASKRQHGRRVLGQLCRIIAELLGVRRDDSGNAHRPAEAEAASDGDWRAHP